MRQVSKERSTILQVEGWDAIQATIYMKEGPHCEGIRISLEREIGKLREDLNIVKLRNEIGRAHV